MEAFLNNAEVAQLTGRKMKGRQIDALRKMGIPFFVNAIGRAVVARCAVEGRMTAAPQQKTPWVPRVLKA
jgi:hypothetical protein